MNVLGETNTVRYLAGEHAIERWILRMNKYATIEQAKEEISNACSSGNILLDTGIWRYIQTDNNWKFPCIIIKPNVYRVLTPLMENMKLYHVE